MRHAYPASHGLQAVALSARTWLGVEGWVKVEVRVGVKLGSGMGMTGVRVRARVIRSYFVRVVARLATCLRVRARLAVRALPAIIARQLAGLGLVLASNALDARCRAIVRRDRAGRTLERLGAAAWAPCPRRAGGAPGRRREPMAAIVRPRGAGHTLGTRRPDVAKVACLGSGAVVRVRVKVRVRVRVRIKVRVRQAVVAWIARAGAGRAVEAVAAAIATSRAGRHPTRCRRAVVAPRAPD